MKSYVTCIALAAVFVSCGNKGGMNLGDNEYPVEAVTASANQTLVNYPGTVKGIQDVEIRPKVSGFITKVCIKEGQAVQAGQLLFEIDNATYQAAVRQAKAAVNTARAQLNTAKLTLDNSQKLFDKNVIGDFELQSSKNAYESAQAQYLQTTASLASAEENLSYCYVKSPTSGVVGSLPYKVGSLVSASIASPLTTVSDISTVEVFFSMTEKEILDMSKGAGSLSAALSRYPAVQLKLADGSVYSHEGKVVKTSGMIDQSTGTVSMIAHFTNPERVLRSGGAVSVVVPHNEDNAIIISQNATVELQNKKYVYLLGKDNKVKFTEITVEPQNDGQNFVVTSGLNVGDKIVTRGLTKLTNDMDITPITTEQYEKKLKQAEQMGSMQGMKH